MSEQHNQKVILYAESLSRKLESIMKKSEDSEQVQDTSALKLLQHGSEGKKCHRTNKKTGIGISCRCLCGNF